MGKFKSLIVIAVCIIFINIFFSSSVVLGLGQGFDYEVVPEGDSGALGFLDQPLNKIWNTVVRVIQIASIAGIVIAGVRYLFSNADQKAEQKKSTIYLIVGIAIVFTATTVIEIVIGIFNGLIL